MSPQRRELENWLKEIEVQGDVLDVGGVSMPVKSRVKGNATFKILDILDSRKGARADYIADLNYYSPIEDKFDHVFCLEVMQFLWNPVQALNNMNSYLK